MKDNDIVSFADGNTPYMSANNITNLIEGLQDSAPSIFKWFANNQMQQNEAKCRVSLSTNEKVIPKVHSAEVKNSRSEKLLRAISYSHVSFEKYTSGKAKVNRGALFHYFSLFYEFQLEKKPLMNEFF